MGLFDGLLGNAWRIDNETAYREYGHLIAEGEELEIAFKIIRDMYLFTNKRLVMIDVEGITGKKIEIRSIPYRSISSFAIETQGVIDLDAEMKIWVAGIPMPIIKKFNKTASIYAIQKVLATFVL